LVSHCKGKTKIEGILENRVLKRAFAIKRDEVTGYWIKSDEELQQMHSWSGQIKEDEMSKECEIDGR
jgi:hypothetical protein